MLYYSIVNAAIIQVLFNYKWKPLSFPSITENEKTIPVQKSFIKKIIQDFRKICLGVRRNCCWLIAGFTDWFIDSCFFFCRIEGNERKYVNTNIIRKQLYMFNLFAPHNHGLEQDKNRQSICPWLLSGSILLLNSLLLINLSLSTFTDPCSNLSCQHICINSKSGAKCFCSEGYNLTADLKTCTGCVFQFTLRQKYFTFWCFSLSSQQCMSFAS